MSNKESKYITLYIRIPRWVYNIIKKRAEEDERTVTSYVAVLIKKIFSEEK